MGVSQYIFTSKAADITWAQAKSEAEALGGQLASIAGDGRIDEQNFLLAILAENPDLFVSHSSLNEKFGPWIGLTQPEGSVENGGGWTWLSGEAFDPFGWYPPNQPDNFEGREDSGHFFIGNSGTIAWNDFPATVPPNGYPQIQSFLTEFDVATAELKGTDGRDLIYGSDVGNTIDAGQGNNYVNGGGGDDTITAGKGNDLIDGGLGNDTIDTGFGLDTARGGQGDDIYLCDVDTKEIIEAAGEGDDTVLIARREGGIYTPFSRFADGQSIERIAMRDTSALFAWNIVGNDLGQLIQGNDGFNIIDGGGGTDTLQGYGGDDEYLVDDSSVVVLEAAEKGNDIIYATVNYVLKDDSFVETIVADVSANKRVNLTGNNLANKLYGSGGINILDGKGGIDIMDGRKGNDIYYVDDNRDKVLELVDGGVQDEIRTTTSYRLTNSQFVEVVRAQSPPDQSPQNINLTGNEWANGLYGSKGADIISGMDGNDTIFGGDGTDIISGDADNDYLEGGGAKDRLNGGAGNDTLLGGAGNDILLGSFGQDNMNGGADSDRFTYSSAEHSKIGAGARDEIYGFDRTDADRDFIDLSSMDAKKATQVDDAFRFLGFRALTGKAGEVALQKSGTNDVLILGDVDGGDADFEILVVNVGTMSIEDFIL